MWRAPAIAIVITSQALLLSAVGLSAHLLQQAAPPPLPPPAVTEADPATAEAWRGLALATLAGLDVPPFEDGIAQLTPQALVLDVAYLEDRLLTDTTATPSVRVLPHYRDGEVDGFRLSGVSPGSLPHRLGLRSGDVLRRLNGAPLSHPSQCFAVLQRPRLPERITLELERQGRPHMVVWMLWRPDGQKVSESRSL